MSPVQRKNSLKVLGKFSDILSGPNSIFYYCLFGLFLVGLFYFLRWPITGHFDTDLWYHLNGGRYFFTHNEPADSGFFSFIANERIWVNYYWLFQTIVYSIFSIFDYQGLIILRTTVYLLTLGCTAYFLLKGNKKDSTILYFTIISALVFLALMHRHFQVVRPHIFSYFLIILFLSIFESKNKYWLFSLPFWAIFWCNVHGVEYPVMMLICFSYLAEILFTRIKTRTALNKETIIGIIPVLLALYAVFVTPFHYRLLFSPFESSQYQYLYIGELRRIPFSEFLNFNFSTVAGSYDSLSNILIFIAIFSCIVGLKTKKIRISHLLLLAGGLFLLARAYRFRYEAVLLALPIIKYHPLIPIDLQNKKISRIGKYAAVAIILILSVSFINNAFLYRAKYPFSKSSVPAGTASFLNRIKVGGKILNYLDHGGYLQWELDKGYSIFMDLEMMLFTDKDIFENANSFEDREILAKTIKKYRPGFITPLIVNKKFEEIIKGFPDYKVVFFDDVVVLYIDSKQYPEISAEYQLQAISPYKLPNMDIIKLSDSETANMLKELLDVHTIYPQGFLVNQALVKLFIHQKKFDRAFEHADSILENFPEQPTGFLLKGDIMAEQHLYEKALAYYKKALVFSDDLVNSATYRRMSLCYINIGQPKKAYRSLKKGVDIFSPSTSVTDYYNLAQLALATGDKKNAAMLLQFAQLKTSDVDKEISERINDKLLKLWIEQPGQK
jgi:hypothetical protein